MTTLDAPAPDFDQRWQQVTCRDCGREFQCTPWDDYYNATCATDGVCERCLLGGRPLIHVVMNEDGTLTAVPRPGRVN